MSFKVTRKDQAFYNFSTVDETDVRYKILLDIDTKNSIFHGDDYDISRRYHFELEDKSLSSILIFSQEDSYNDKNPSEKFITTAKEGRYDEPSAKVILKNPKQIDSELKINIKVTAVAKGNSSLKRDVAVIPLTLYTSYRKLDFAEPKITISPSKIIFDIIENVTKDQILNISTEDLSKYINPLYSGSTLYLNLEIKNDVDNLLSFKNGTKLLQLIHISNKKFANYNDIIKIKNPNKFGYSSDVTILYSLYRKDNSPSNPSGIKIYETELPLSVATKFEDKSDINIDVKLYSSQSINFKTSNEEDKKYNLSFDITNKKSFTPNNILEIRLVSDDDNYINFTDTGNNILEVEDIANTDLNYILEVINPKKANYNKNIKLQFTIFSIADNGSRNPIFKKSFDFFITNINANLDNKLNINLINDNSIIFSNMHEFRRNINYDFEIQNISTLTNTDTAYIEIQILDDVDNLFGVFDNDTKTLVVDLNSKINVLFTLTNPTQLNYNKSLNIKTSIIEFTTDGTQKVYLYSKLIPINIITTYTSKRRAIFKGEKDILISNVNLDPKIIKTTIDNEIFFNQETFSPSITFSNDDAIIFDNENTLTKDITISASISGLLEGGITFYINPSDEKLFTFENGLRQIDFDLIGDINELSNIEFIMTVKNPFQLNYNKSFELLYSIDDTIDVYSNKFVFNIQTTYSPTSISAWIINVAGLITKDIKTNLDEMTSSTTEQVQALEAINQTTFDNINKSLSAFDQESLINSLNLETLFKNIESIIKADNTFLDLVLQEIDQQDISINDIEINLYKEDILFNTIDYNKISFRNDILQINDLVLDKGSYSLEIYPKNKIVKILNIDSVINSNTYTILKFKNNINFDYSGYKLKYNHQLFDIISNNNNEMLIFGYLIFDESITVVDIYTNKFEPIYFYLNVTNYDIDDVGAVFLNKKITDIKNNIEQIYDIDDKNILFELKYITENNIQTRTKNN